MREVCRQPFQRPDHNYPKRNFISKKDFSKLCSELRLNLILYERGTQAAFSKARSQLPKKKLHFKKKKDFSKLCFELHLDLILYERGTQAAFSKTQSQSLKKLFFKGSKSKLFFFVFCVNLGQEHLFCIKRIINFLCKHV